MITNNLKIYREQKGLSQLQLSMKTGIAHSAICNIENERIFPYPGWRKRISIVLGIDEEEVFPGCRRKEA